MPQGGTLTIALKVNHAEDDKPDMVELTVQDTGTGMAPSTQENIFAPFFTTKEVGKGTGLGLSIVYGIIQEHKGQITCESVKGKGVTFTIELPVAGC